MNERSIITIDPGKSGGIAFYHNGETTVIYMPEHSVQIQNEMNKLKDHSPVVFIEKVTAFRSGGADDAPGKSFGINKMLFNYAKLITIIEICGFDYVEVAPISWQAALGLRVHKDKRTKTERKRAYKVFAQENYPDIKVTLKSSDALCLVKFALLKYELAPEWIEDKMQTPFKLIKEFF